MARNYRLLMLLAVGVVCVGIVTLSLSSTNLPVSHLPVPVISLPPDFNGIYPTLTPFPTELPAGNQAPIFVLNGIDGKSYTLAAYRGKYIILNFWASWCAPCRIEMPLLEQTFHQNHDVVILAINNGEDADVVQQYVKELGLTFPILLDKDASVTKKYGIPALPTSYFIDPNGALETRFIGALTTQDLQSYLRQIATLEAIEHRPQETKGIPTWNVR